LKLISLKKYLAIASLIAFDCDTIYSLVERRLGGEEWKDFGKLGNILEDVYV